jgi:hypothetical protein
MPSKSSSEGRIEINLRPATSPEPALELDGDGAIGAHAKRLVP